LLLALVCIAIVGAGMCLAKGPSESQVKAAFLYNFARFVEWPAQAFSDANSPIVVGIVSDGDVADEVDQVAKGKTVDGRRLVTKRLSDKDDFQGCHVLFISSAEKRRVGGLLDRARDSSVLTVGETDGFMQSGGVIGFVVEDNRVGFEVNTGAAKRKHLKISSQLLRLAREVKE
jgi:hypothetical protein